MSGCKECGAQLGHNHEIYCSMHCCPLSERLRKEIKELRNSRIVYVAGPYTHPDPEENVRKAIDVGHTLMDLGYYPFVPHLSHFMEMQRSRPYTDWMLLDFQFVDISGSLLRLPGTSPGAEQEVKRADSKGIPVFYSIEQLHAYYTQKEKDAGSL